MATALVIVGVLVALYWVWFAVRQRRLVPTTVHGDDMAPTLRSGQSVVVETDKQGHGQGDVVAFRVPGATRLTISRVAAAAGDPVPVELRDVVSDTVVPQGFLLVRGDNPNAADWPAFGFVGVDQVAGRVWLPTAGAMRLLWP